MKCSECHIENSDDNKFCRECGTALLSLCSKCGNELQAGDKFCGNCGQKVVEEAGEETTQVTSEGERKHVTVLFSDLTGYTAMAENWTRRKSKKLPGAFWVRYEKSSPNTMALLKNSPGMGLAICYSLQDGMDEAHAAAQKALKANPQFTIGGLVKRSPYKNQEDIDRMVTALQKAGLK